MPEAPPPRPPRSGPQASTPWRQPLVRTVLALEAAVVLALALAGWSSYRQTLSAETDLLQVMARAVAARVEGSLQATEATLQATLREVRDPQMPLPDEVLAVLLRGRVEQLPVFDTLAIVDAEGWVQHIASDSALRLPPRRIRLSEALARASRFELGQATVEAQAGPAAPEQALLAAVLPWTGPDASRRGSIVALAEPRFFDERLFQQLTSGHSPVLGLWTAGGLALSAGGLQGDERAVGQWLRAHPAMRPTEGELPPALPGGVLPAVVAVLQPLAEYPLIISVSRGRDRVLAGWKTQIQSLGALTFLVLAGVLAFAVRSTRVSERLQAAQAESRASAARLAERLQTAHRMEALGTLAGGIAHDFNNVLAVIMGFGELARDAAPAGSSQARQLDQVLQAGARGQGLVERILSFSRPRDPRGASGRFEAQPVVAEVITMLRGSLRPDIRLVADLDAPGAMVDGDSILLFESVMNLCTNALHAMPDGGEMRVWLRRTADESGVEHLELQVHDTGTGIAPEVMPRIFEPFFSHPAPGPDGPSVHWGSAPSSASHVGTGLGLAVVQGAMRALGGAVRVDSQPGEGSTFTLQLPMAGSAARGEPSGAEGPGSQALGSDEPRGPSLPTGYGQTVMWVDDEPSLVAYGEDLLAGLGYEPVGFTSPLGALEALRREPGRFDALVTDLVMPDFNGLDFATAAQALQPGLAVLMVSGQEPEAQVAPLGILAGRLTKPIDRQRLAQALHQALAA